jgi:cytochrome c-type protein NapB
MAIKKMMAGSLLLCVSLYAMDMSKVDSLTEEIRAILSGKSTATTSQSQSSASEQNVQAKEVVAETAAASTSESSGGTVSEESLGLRKTDLYSEDKVTPAPVKYTAAAPGSAKRFDRAYENAPPMIPHSVEGLLPITKNNNACLGCHMPDVAPSMGATPIPPSHFRNFRPVTKLGENGEVLKEGHTVKNTSDIKMVVRKQDTLYQGRYNCSQCHAPQADVKPLVKNNFTPDFRSPDSVKKSNLLDTINEGVE